LSTWNVARENYVKRVVVDRFITNPDTLVTDKKYGLQTNVINWIGVNKRYAALGRKYISSTINNGDPINVVLYMLHFMRYLVEFDAIGGGSRATHGGSKFDNLDWSDLVVVITTTTCEIITWLIVLLFIIYCIWRIA
jgi:hypothetical protein